MGVGAMAAVLGLDLAAVEAVAAEAARAGAGEVCEAANDNDPAQVVVSGHKAAVERAVEIAKAKGAKRAMLLPVSAPFHCALMQPAADAMAEALAAVAIAAPGVPVVANVKAEAVRDPDEIRALLVAQVTGRVRWRESVAWMAGQGVSETVEVGAGNALSGMIRRIAKEIETKAVGSPDDVRALAGEGTAMFDLTGKAALVTGASGGIGGAIARALHGQGAAVALSGTRVAPLEALAGELGERSHVVPCDLSDAAAVEALPKQAAAAMGQVDILVNNAGITRDQLFMRMSDADWEAVIAVNLTSVMRLSRGVLRGMMKARWGRIVNVSSIVGVTGNAGQANYAASKAGVIGMSKSLAAEVASRGVTVNCVAPGFIATAMTDVLTDEQKARIDGADPGRAHGRGGGNRRRGGLSGLLGGGLCHRADAARERRDGDDLRDHHRDTSQVAIRARRARGSLHERLRAVPQ